MLSFSNSNSPIIPTGMYGATAYIRTYTEHEITVGHVTFSDHFWC